METKEIIEGSKLIAEFLGFVYLPFSAELKEKGMKAGYYKTASAEPVYSSGEIKINMTPFRYSVKSGWKLFEGQYYKYICRTHGDLKFWNSLDELVPVIQKIEREKVENDERFAVIEKDSNKVVDGFLNYSIQLYNNGASCEAELLGGFSVEISSSFDLPNWSNNVFKVIVEYLKTK